MVWTMSGAAGGGVIRSECDGDGGGQLRDHGAAVDFEGGLGSEYRSLNPYNPPSMLWHTMASEDKGDIPEKNWYCEHFRLTVFTQPFQLDSASNWWSDTTGDTPSKSTSEPKIGGRADEGPYKGRLLTLTIRPGRVDWILAADPSQLRESPFSSIGGVTEAFDVFGSLFEPWLRISPKAIRVAIGTAAMLPVSDRAEGYRKLQPLLP